MLEEPKKSKRGLLFLLLRDLLDGLLDGLLHCLLGDLLDGLLGDLLHCLLDRLLGDLLHCLFLCCHSVHLLPYSAEADFVLHDGSNESLHRSLRAFFISREIFSRVIVLYIFFEKNQRKENRVKCFETTRMNFFSRSYDEAIRSDAIKMFDKNIRITPFRKNTHARMDIYFKKFDPSKMYASCFIFFSPISKIVSV